MTNLSSVQIIGQSIEMISNAFLSQNLATKFIVDAFGEKPQPDQFYPIEEFINALNSIESKMNSAVLRKVGMHVMSAAKWPPGVTNAWQGMSSISVAYKMNHKPNNPAIIGDYVFEKLSDQEGKLTCTNPYPCAFDDGIIHGISKAFNQKVIVKHLDGSCRKKGDKTCTYLIKFL